jgi:predicted branched-subunit amino acid permease
VQKNSLFSQFNFPPEFLAGIQAMLELSVGLFAWSVVTNLAILKMGLGPWETVGMTTMIYAGSSQIAVLPLIFAEYPFWTIWITALIINIRFLLFSASLQPHFKHLPIHQRMTLGYFNGDMSYVRFIAKYPQPSPLHNKQDVLNFFLGASLTNWVVWQSGLVVAVVFGSQRPNSWGLEFAGTLALVTLIIPSIKSPTAILSALAAIATCILTINLPYRLAIICSVIAGIITAMVSDKVLKKGSQ